jgi:lipoprotein-releasing system permease protein
MSTLKRKNSMPFILIIIDKKLLILNKNKIKMNFQKFFIKEFFKIKGKRDFFSLNSLISIVGITIGVIALTVSLALFSGYQKVLKETILGVNSHIYIFKYGNQSIDKAEFSRIKAILDTTFVVHSYAPFIYTEAMVSNSQRYRDKMAGVILRGIDYKAEKKTTQFQEFIKEGRFVPKGEYGVIGEKLAKKLQVGVGDTINLITPLNADITITGIIPKRTKIEISGIFSSGMFDYDNTLLYMNMEASQDFLNMPGQFSGIAVQLIPDEIERASFHSKEILSSLGFPFKVTDWIELNGNLFSLLKLEKWVIFLILALIVVVAGFGMISVLTMQIIDKSKEIGILKVMGAQNSEIKRVFLLRNVILGFAGIILGILLGVLLSQIITHTNLVKIESDVYFINKLVVKNNPMDFVYIILVAGLVILGSALIPLKSIGKMDPVSIIRGVKK